MLILCKQEDCKVFDTANGHKGSDVDLEDYGK